MKEEWRKIDGFEYEVSNLGRVRSMPWIQKHSTGSLFQKKSKIISPRIGTSFNGYSSIGLTKNGKQQSLFLHRVIAKAFIPNPENKPFINHINGIKTDNRIENLEWCTRSENARHSFIVGLQCNKGERHPSSKLTTEDVYAIRLAYKSGMSSWRIYKDYFSNISYTNIKDIISKRTWSHV